MEKYPEVASRYYGKAAPTGKDGIVALNTMLAQDGFVVYVPEGVVVERPIQLVNIFRSDVDTMANRRILVIMEPRSEAKLLVCDHSIDDVKFLATQVVEIFAGEGAFFDYYDLEESSMSTTRFASVHVKQEAGSNVLVNGITLNNGLTRNNYYIELNGEQAEATLCGMSILDKEQQLDTYSHITHAVPYCTSNELFKNVLDDHAVGAFSGRILVTDPEAPVEVHHAAGSVGKNVVQLIEEGKIDMILNTPNSRGSRSDGYSIRAAAIAADLPQFTTITEFQAALLAIEAVKHNDYQIMSIQEHSKQLFELERREF